MIKSLSKLRIEGKCSKLIKSILNIFITNIIVTSETPKCCSLTLRIWQECLFSSFLCYIVLEALANEMKQEKGTKWIKIKKKEVRLSLQMTC